MSSGVQQQTEQREIQSQKRELEAGVVVHVGNLSTSAISKREDFEFKASLGYIESLSPGQLGSEYLM